MPKILSLLSVASLALSALAADAAALEIGSGLSMAKDPKAAGAEAAKEAKAALGETEPKLVLVYYHDPMVPQAAQVVEGAATVFEKDILFGSGAYAALTEENNNGHVAILALGGDVGVTTAMCETKGPKDDVSCGEAIGKQLQAGLQATQAPGKVALLFGACHIPRNNNVVKGMTRVLGETFPVIGAASFRDSVVARGQVVEGKVNVGILLTGDFTCDFGLRKDMSTKGLIASARQAFQSAIGEDQKRTALVLTFDCGGRRGAMLKKNIFEKELAAMKEVAGDTPIFGFYGSGEMGCTTAGKAPKGVGYHIATCAIKSK